MGVGLGGQPTAAFPSAHLEHNKTDEWRMVSYPGESLGVGARTGFLGRLSGAATADPDLCIWKPLLFFAFFSFFQHGSRTGQVGFGTPCPIFSVTVNTVMWSLQGTSLLLCGTDFAPNLSQRGAEETRRLPSPSPSASQTAVLGVYQQPASDLRREKRRHRGRQTEKHLYG